MASTLSEIDEVRRHMAQIRKELHEDVQGVVKGAEAATDWRRYVRNYPWITVGVAFGLGFLLVPRRQHPPVGTTVNFSHADQGRPVAYAAPSAPEPEKKKRKGLFRTVIGLAAPFALRSAQGYALQFFEQYLAQKMAQQQSPFANMAASFMNNGGGNPDGSPQQPTPPRYPV